MKNSVRRTFTQQSVGEPLKKSTCLAFLFLDYLCTLCVCWFGRIPDVVLSKLAKVIVLNMQDPEDVVPTRLVGYFFLAWCLLAVVLSIGLNR